MATCPFTESNDGEMLRNDSEVERTMNGACFFFLG